jgi:tetratricopeptide (TPR) repeat protein
MAIIYKVTVSIAEENRFQISWFNKQTGEKDGFNQEAPYITAEELQKIQYNPGYGLNIGEKMFRFLDGDTLHLRKALSEAIQYGESLILYLDNCKETSSWPFELLAQDGTFLLPHCLHLVRSISDWGEKKKYPLKDRPLKLLFMACSAMDIQPEPDFEKEEETIFQVTANLAVDMDVEDSGSLEGLRQRLEREQYDVVHLSGHTHIDKKGRPYFIMEDETGHRHQVSPDELWSEALIENPPRLLFISRWEKDLKPGSPAPVSLARCTAAHNNAPAVLEWGWPVSDEQAALAAETIYRQLSRGKGILEAVQRARYRLTDSFPPDKFAAWPFLRLFGSSQPLNAIVTDNPKKHLRPVRMAHSYLKRSQVKVLAEGFVGRRRQLQHSLRVLKFNHDKVGLILHGTGGLGKSCLAGKICERLKNHTLTIVKGKLDAIHLKAALKDAFIAAEDEKGEEMLEQKLEMPGKLEKLCASSFKEKNYLLLFDDFEQNLEGGTGGHPGRLLPEPASLLQTLLHYLPFSGKMTQLIITCRYLFSLSGQVGDRVLERLEPVCLTGFSPVEQRKKAKGLRNFTNYSALANEVNLLAAGRGNPLLMEWLDPLVGQRVELEVPQLLEAIKYKQEEFINSHGIQGLIRHGGDELRRLLSWFSVFRRPVLIQGVEEIGKKAEVKNPETLLKQGTALSLVEHDQARKNYRVTPLVREELWASLDPHHIGSCHQAAFDYYTGICVPMSDIKPHLVEELIYHALDCGEEDTAAEQGGRLVDYLAERLNFRESRRIGEWILSGKKQALSTAHDSFLLNKLAAAVFSLGDYRKAIHYFQHALEIDEALFGRKHLNVARVLNNLGLSWTELGESSKSAEYFQEAVNIWKEIYGETHIQVAEGLNNLGSAWFALSHPRKAIDYFQQALAISKKLFGENHRLTAAGLNNLGAAWAELSHPLKAVTFIQQAIAILKEVYGENHPQVGGGLNNLGKAWVQLNEPLKAIDYFQQALGMWQNVYGVMHPQAASGMSNLGAAYFNLGQQQKAKEYFEKAYAIFQEFLGTDHPSTQKEKRMLEKCQSPPII